MSHTCGITTSGRAYCWGLNDYGQIGDGSTAPRALPTAVASGHTFTAITAGSEHTCALATTGLAYCWGGGSGGQLGTGDRPNMLAYREFTPVQVSTNTAFESIVAGYRHTCALGSGGVAYCWGSYSHGALGRWVDVLSSPTHTRPFNFSTPLRFSVLTAGNQTTCGLSSTRTAYCWGWNSSGQIGDGTQNTDDKNNDRFTPTPVVGGHLYIALSAGDSHACGLTTQRLTYCWGSGSSGELGDGMRTNRLTPTAVQTTLRFEAVTTGGGFTCALSDAGDAYCWGKNGYGSLGDGTLERRLTPVRVRLP